ncbi:hypothetical protein [Roseicella frigidaeris]|uniref:Uncharacterized protein n=1 Tax=Roseicella frigidaeris TaxID=2230885 RepID=A0A327M452_9PROT|nr:hypothetical protein [Roseicella frigidaeris]RAI57155.1 hypothetical protein DOO78_20145 [Roseicella frigidaeris]
MPFLLPQLAATSSTATRPRAVVALAAGQQPALLVRCLCALALQRSRNGLWLAPGAFGAVVVPEGPVAPLQAALQPLGPSLPFLLTLAPPAATHAALREALARAAAWVAPEGPVLTTLAAAVPEPHWLERAMAGLADGADAVFGEAVAPAAGPDPAARYAGLLAALAARLDPDPADPHPAHGQETVASFALRAGLLARPEGLLPGPEGFPGLLAALRRQDGRLRHVAGMRVEAELSPGPVEPVLAWRRRLLARRALRAFWEQGIGLVAAETPGFRGWARRLGLPAGALGSLLAAPRFGAAWAAVEAASPVLSAARPLPPETLPRQMRLARLLLTLAPRAPAAPEPGIAA